MRRTRPAVGGFKLDLGRYELRRLGRRVEHEKKPMELLIFLVGRREQLVSRKGDRGEIVALGSLCRYRAQYQQHRAKNPDGPR